MTSMSTLPRLLPAVLLSASLCFAALQPVCACIWETGDKRSLDTGQLPYGSVAEPEVLRELLNPPAIDAAEWTGIALSHRNTGTDQPNAAPAARNDYAVALILSEDHTKTIDVLERLEKDEPGLYMTAANLGTAYELAGDAATALKWSREGIRRDPNSHYGTEWLHVRILEAKLALAEDPQWLDSHTVLGADFGPGLLPVRTPLGQDNTGADLSTGTAAVGIVY
jgi:tetratricopeptide (TPR) repeat protein